ncbi:MAG: glycosyltransferase [Planctomycetota bacterium]|jgi:glycosyltransferase involved in cell wall biosynthesis
MKPEETTVVVTGAQEYWAPTSTQSLRMAEAFLAAGCRVLYFECGGDGRAFAAKVRDLEAISPGVHRADDREGLFLARAERLPGTRLSFPNFARYLHCRSASRKAAGFLDALGAPGTALVAHYGWFFPEFLAEREGTLHLYECLDDHTAALNIRGSAWRRAYVSKVEARLLASADLTVFSSPVLASSRSGTARRAEVIPLGVENERFARPPQRDPHEGKGIGRPRVGFLGRITDREDWAMAARAAEAAPDLQWVVLGPFEGAGAPSGPDNLHFLGPVPYAELPDWLGSWDAAFVPLADSEFNRAAWPLKFYELLAAGLGAASTPIPAALELEKQTGGLVVPASGWGPEEMLAAVRAALELKDRADAEGRAFAARHSWRSRAERILELLG